MSADERRAALAAVIHGDARRCRASSADCGPCNAYADAVLAAGYVPPDEVAALRDRLAAAEALAAEWDTEGASLVRHAYSGRDVAEGTQMRICAAALRGERP